MTISKLQKRTIAFTFVFAVGIMMFMSLFNLSNINASAVSLSVNITSSDRGGVNVNGGYVNKNDKLTITAAGSGGTSYKYSFSVMAPGNSWSTFQSSSSTASATYTVHSSGEYKFKVSMQSTGNSPINVEKSVTVYDLQNNSTISANSITINDSVSVTAAASGGSSNYSYKYYYKKGSSGTETPFSGTSIDWVTTTSRSFKPTETGSYLIYVIVKDKNTQKEISKNFSLTVNQQNTKVTNNSTINKTSLYKGDKLVIQAAATGGTGEYLYIYELCNVDGTSFVRYPSSNYTSKETYSYEWASSTVGTFMAKITVVDKNNSSNTAVKKLTFEVKDKEYPTLTLTGSIDRTDILTPNNSLGKDSFTINASASGGTGSGYKYSFHYKTSGMSEYKVFGSDTSVSESQGNESETSSFTGQIKKAGTYQVLVQVSDSRRSVVAVKTFKVIVKQAPVYNKSNLLALLTQVNNWYDGLTKSQKEQFIALKRGDGVTIENFHYPDWEKAKLNAENFYKTGNEINTDTYYNELKKQHDLAQKQDLQSTEESDVFYSVNETLTTVLNWLLNGIGNMMIQNFGTSGEDDAAIKGFDIQSFVDMFSPIFMIFANALLVLLFGVNVISSALQYELFTLKGGAKTLGRLFLAKVWIDLSCKICMSVISIAASLLSDIVSKSQNMLYGIEFHFRFTYDSGIPVVGRVIDFIVMLLIVVLLFFMMIPLLYFLIKVLIKLFIMNFELAGLTAMSPAFFACLVGEETRQYFKNFFVTFLSVVGELIFMGIVYAAFIMWYNSAGNLSVNADLSDFTIGNSIGNLLTFAIVFIAACHLMVHPPQVFKSLIK